MQGRVRFSCIQHAALMCYLKPSESCGLTGLIFSSQRCINLWLQSMGLNGSFRFCKSGMGNSCLRTQWYWCISSLCVGLTDMHWSLGTGPWERQRVYLKGRDRVGGEWRLHNIRHGLREWLKVILTLLHRWPLKSEIIAKDDYFRLVSSGMHWERIVIELTGGEKSHLDLMWWGYKINGNAIYFLFFKCMQPSAKKIIN